MIALQKTWYKNWNIYFKANICIISSVHRKYIAFIPKPKKFVISIENFHERFAVFFNSQTVQNPALNLFKIHRKNIKLLILSLHIFMHTKSLGKTFCRCIYIHFHRYHVDIVTSSSNKLFPNRDLTQSYKPERLFFPHILYIFSYFAVFVFI